LYVAPSRSPEVTGVTVTGSPEVTRDAESSTPENDHSGGVTSSVADMVRVRPERSVTST
jgi:hypothetical protein